VVLTQNTDYILAIRPMVLLLRGSAMVLEVTICDKFTDLELLEAAACGIPPTWSCYAAEAFGHMSISYRS
jgi:hypothetical protein